MADGNFTVVGLGELLWDLFPAGKQLGGAPANFAYISSLLGDHGVVASRIGRDPLGEEAKRRFQHFRLPTDFLQLDSTRPTGTVKVLVDAVGQPQYEITDDVSWDFLEMTSEWRALAAQASAISFGSLAQRSVVSRGTILDFLAAARSEAVRIFDVNLRQSFYSPEILADSARRANIIKLNQEELPKVMDLLGAPKSSAIRGDTKTEAQWLFETTGAQLICITRGGAGSLLVSPDSSHEHGGFPVRVKDTVGAGDAFAAALVHHFLRGAPLSAMNEAANRMGAWVASCAGAMPDPDPTILEKVRNAHR
jgi:fructokinase